MTAPDPPKDKKAVSFEKEQDEREEDVVVESQESGDPLLDPVPNGKPENDDSSIDEKERPSEADEENARIAFLLKQSGESVSVRDGGAFNDTKFTSLPEDTFSFVISSKPLSFPFVTAFGVYALKTLIFYLVLVNLISGDVNFNKVGVPDNCRSKFGLLRQPVPCVCHLGHDSAGSCLCHDPRLPWLQPRNVRSLWKGWPRRWKVCSMGLCNLLRLFGWIVWVGGYILVDRNVFYGA